MCLCMKSFSLSSHRLTEANSALRAQHRLLLVRHFFSISFLCLFFFLNPSHCSWFQPHRKCLAAHERVGLRSINVISLIFRYLFFFVVVVFRSTSKTRMQSPDWLHQTVKKETNKTPKISSRNQHWEKTEPCLCFVFSWCFGQRSKGKLLKKKKLPLCAHK